MSKKILTEAMLLSFYKNAGLLESVEHLDELSDETRNNAQAKRNDQLKADPSHKSGNWFPGKVDHYGYDAQKQHSVQVDHGDPRAYSRDHQPRDHANRYYNDASARSHETNRTAYKPLVDQVKHQALEMLVSRAKDSGLDGVVMGMKTHLAPEIVVGPLKLHPQATDKIKMLRLGTIHAEKQNQDMPVSLVLGNPQQTGIILYAQQQNLRAIQSLLNLQMNLQNWANDSEEMLVNLASSKGPQGIAALDKSSLPPLRNYLNKINQDVVKLVQLLPKELQPQGRDSRDIYLK
jgi:hypothetical protein